MKYFRVKIGYGKDEFISIDETELGRAIRAQVSGRIALFKEGTVAGNHIISIIPDYNKELGFNRDYQMTEMDYKGLGKRAIQEHRLLLEEVENDIQQKLINGSLSEQRNLLE